MFIIENEVNEGRKFGESREKIFKLQNIGKKIQAAASGCGVPLFYIIC